MAMKSGAVSVSALIALREAEVRLAQAQLALAQAKAGVQSAPKAPARKQDTRKASAPTPAPAPAQATPADTTPRTYTIADPDAPATRRQLWALHLYTGLDTRDLVLTKGEASARIEAAKAKRAAERDATPAAAQSA